MYTFSVHSRERTRFATHGRGNARAGSSSQLAPRIDIAIVVVYLLVIVAVGVMAQPLAKWMSFRARTSGRAATASDGDGYGGGILAAMVQRSAFPSLPDYVGFLGTGLISTVLMFGVTLATPPTPMPALVKFYTNTRPSGFWGPLAALALEKDGFDGQEPEGASI